MRLYFFMLYNTLVWTSDRDRFSDLLENKNYRYMGYIDPENKCSGGPNIEPAIGENYPLG